MVKPVTFDFIETDLDAFATAQGRVAVLVDAGAGRMTLSARRVNRLTRGAVDRLIETRGKDLKPGDVVSLSFPTNMAAEAVDIVNLPNRPDQAAARKAGAALARARGGKPLLISTDGNAGAANLVHGLALRDYSFDDHKSGQDDKAQRALTVMAAKPQELSQKAAPLLAVTEGVFFTRDLTNEPANVLTTSEFASRIEGLKALGLKVEVLDEATLEKENMRALLAVGQGSASPSKVAVMQWEGGEQGAAPLALVGKGVVFDTGGISIKPAGGMEDMTMDMGGAGVVAGTMMALALRKAKANVVGLVGLVENMPSGTATRPGDVVASRKGDTVEIINTDAEGRLVLCDVMDYAQERFKPAAMIDLATLTGAIIVALGYENAGVFSNDDTLCNAFLKSASAEGEGAWRMPLGKAYDDLLKSPIADMKNVGGRPAGSVTAAEFLHRFVQEGVPWIHLDIAGVASVKGETAHAPKGATGWGVMALSRLVSDHFEGA